MLKDELKKLRLSKGMTQAELAEKLGISPQAVQRWEAGKSSPSAERIPVLAKCFGVASEFLAEKAKVHIKTGHNENEKKAPFPKEERGEIMNRRTSTQKETLSAEPNISEQRLNMKNVIWIPVISPILKCSAGDGNNYENSDVAWDIVSKYPLFDGPLSALYNDECLSGMYAEGDSMEPQIHDGDLVVFVHDETWIPGNIAIVRLDGKLFVKGILKGKNGYILRSQNKNYADIEVHDGDDFSVVGRVVKIITDRNPKPIL